MPGSSKIFDSSDFIFENLAIIDVLKGGIYAFNKELMLNNPNYLYLFKLDTLTSSCDTDAKVFYSFYR